MTFNVNSTWLKRIPWQKRRIAEYGQVIEHGKLLIHEHLIWLKEEARGSEHGS